MSLFISLPVSGSAVAHSQAGRRAGLGIPEAEVLNLEQVWEAGRSKMATNQRCLKLF